MTTTYILRDFSRLVAFLTCVLSAFMLFTVQASALIAQDTQRRIEIPVSDTCPYTFSRSLTIGATGEDVKHLQQFLNTDAETRLYGAVGGPGYETEYFGSVTAAALVRFQEKYSKNVLAPANLAKGTGYFGPLTRAYMNTLCSSGVTDGNPVIDISYTGTREVTVDISLSGPVQGKMPAVTGPVLVGTIDWGDGKTENLFALAGSRITVHVVHTYDHGFQSYTIKVADSAGNATTTTTRELMWGES